MITDKEYAILSELIYNKDTEDFTKKITKMNFNLVGQYGKLTDAGYVAAALEREGEVVFVHRGTDRETIWRGMRSKKTFKELFEHKLISGDISACAQIFQGAPVEQFPLAERFVAETKEKFSEEYNFSHTGHSKGAYLSLMFSVIDGTKSVVFDLPAMSTETAKSLNPELVPEELPVTAYFAAPNLINAGDHVIKKFRYIEFAHKLHPISYYGFAQFSLRQHAIKNFPEFLDSYQELDSWPNSSEVYSTYAQFHPTFNEKYRQKFLDRTWQNFLREYHGIEIKPEKLPKLEQTFKNAMLSDLFGVINDAKQKFFPIKMQIDIAKAALMKQKASEMHSKIQEYLQGIYDSISSKYQNFMNKFIANKKLELDQDTDAFAKDAQREYDAFKDAEKQRGEAELQALRETFQKQADDIFASRKLSAEARASSSDSSGGTISVSNSDVVGQYQAQIDARKAELEKSMDARLDVLKQQLEQRSKEHNRHKEQEVNQDIKRTSESLTEELAALKAQFSNMGDQWKSDGSSGEFGESSSMPPELREVLIETSRHASNILGLPEDEIIGEIV